MRYPAASRVKDMKMDDAPSLPTDEQKQRAKWDLLLADLEYRQEQLRLARKDIDYRDEQMRQARQEIQWKPWQIAITTLTAGMTAGAALFAAGAAFVKLTGG